eukprot:Pgem_evm1s19332
MALPWSLDYVHFYTKSTSRLEGEHTLVKGPKCSRRVTKNTPLRTTAVKENGRLRYRQASRVHRNQYSHSTAPIKENIIGVSQHLTPHANTILWNELQASK